VRKFFGWSILFGLALAFIVAAGHRLGSVGMALEVTGLTLVIVALIIYAIHLITGGP
jgi:hypothetical protein